jgi:hypothetical protein
MFGVAQCRNAQTVLFHVALKRGSGFIAIQVNQPKGDAPRCEALVETLQLRGVRVGNRTIGSEENEHKSARVLVSERMFLGSMHVEDAQLRRGRLGGNWTVSHCKEAKDKPRRKLHQQKWGASIRSGRRASQLRAPS